MVSQCRLWFQVVYPGCESSLQRLRVLTQQQLIKRKKQEKEEHEKKRADNFFFCSTHYNFLPLLKADVHVQQIYLYITFSIHLHYAKKSRYVFRFSFFASSSLSCMSCLSEGEREIVITNKTILSVLFHLHTSINKVV